MLFLHPYATRLCNCYYNCACPFFYAPSWPPSCRRPWRHKPHPTASAASPAVPAASTPVVTRATIKFELLQALADDGVITAEQKSAAVAKYAAKDDTTRLVAYTDDESWTRHVTWSLTLKCLGLLLLFAAMWGWVKEFARHFNGWLRKIPLVVYQGVLLSISLAGLIVPHLIYRSLSVDQT